MLRNYLLVTVRNLRRQRAYAFITIMGLAVGITCSVLILLFVRDELSYDRFYEEADHIYRVISHVGEDELLVTPSLIAPHLERTLPVVEKTVRVINQTAFRPMVVKNEEQMFQETRFFYADSNFFQLFTLPFVSGDPGSSLVRPHTVVMTQSMARKYFGQEDPLGRVILVDDVPYEISGVIEDLPENTHLKFDFVASLVTRSNWAELSDISWRSANFSTYLLMRDIGGQEAVLHELSSLAEREIGEWLQQTGRSYSFSLQPLTGIHIESRNTRVYVYIFSVIAVLILLVACINYMNLATARALRRAREVGVRKMVGASRSQLIGQFYCESLLLTGIALLFALLFIELALPSFSALSGKALSFAAAGGYFVPLALAGTWLVVALLAGSYPALVLSSFAPVSVLKHAMKTTVGAVLFRRGLVVFQFAISALLIFGTIVVVEQPHPRGEQG